MPLPPALAARLAKRGILKPDSSAIDPPQAANEEIIAEDYDNKQDQTGNTGQEQFWGGIEGVNVDPIKGHIGCPNKSNIYHECSLFCVQTWKKGKSVPDELYFELKNRVLALWPLPPGWEEVYDEGCGQHYFWNVHNNLVSWYPPAHPKAIITESAAHLREERLLKEGDESDAESGGESDQEVPVQPPPKEKRNAPSHKRDKREREKESVHHRDKKKARVKDNDLDPMDPASYSEVPRGKWSAGLDAEGGKTGVDTTASGPLFQMRPYPAPGAILAANAKAKQSSPPPT